LLKDVHATSKCYPIRYDFPIRDTIYFMQGVRKSPLLADNATRSARCGPSPMRPPPPPPHYTNRGLVWTQAGMGGREGGERGGGQYRVVRAAGLAIRGQHVNMKHAGVWCAD